MRNREMYPVALQAFVDFFFVGVALCVDSALHFWAIATSRPGNEEWHNSIPHCICLFGFSILNEISTPMTTLALAVHRFYKVIKPFTANAPNFSKYVLWGNIAITIIPLLVMVPNVVAVVKSPSSYLGQTCYAGMFGNETKRIRIGSVVFFGVPALLCLVLYIIIGRGLLRMRTMQKRNRQLTIIFMVSCLLWFVFWLPERFLHFYMGVEGDEVDLSFYLDRSKVFFFFYSERELFSMFFSLVQPVFIILSYKPLREPIALFYRNLRGKCDCCIQSQTSPDNS